MKDIEETIRNAALEFARSITRAVTDEINRLVEGATKERATKQLKSASKPVKQKVPNKRPPKDEDLRRDVIAYADRHGSEFAAQSYGVSKATIAAWRAHRTMGTYKDEKPAVKKRSKKARRKSRARKKR